jgi:CheY-like chemotaxis protein/DNA-binding MarR family transcriptional regulator
MSQLTLNAGAAGASRSALDVLVVEDDPVALDLLVSSLARMKFDCKGASDALKALDLMAEGHSPTVIVSDIRMPGLNGLDFVERLGDFQGRVRPEIVFVSGHAGFDDAIAALRLGARDLLTKPIDLRRLIEVVAAALRDREFFASPDPTAGASPPKGPGSEDPLRPDAVAKSVLGDLRRLRRLRARHLPPGVETEPCWEMLLDLYDESRKGRPLSVTSLAGASGLPMTSALRRLQELEGGGLITRIPDDRDKRRATILLTDKGRAAVGSFTSAYLRRREQ